MSFILPELINSQAKKTRRVGYEIEYAGIEIETSAYILNKLLNGEIEHASPFCLTINDTQYGTFRLEVDAAFLKDEKYLRYLDKIGIDIQKLDAKESLEDLLKDVASTVVPCEIVMPPIPMTDMAIADDIVKALRQNRAKGTRASFLYAFGLHINPEVVSTDANYLLNHIRAFILLFDLISEETGVDLSRRITPYINKYPPDYIKKVLDPDYAPNITQLIDDYMELNPSRNHALDMLPMFADIDRERVMQFAKEPELINARPTFHYRLANSLIDEADWKISDEWNYWVKIETLAGNKELLEDLCVNYLGNMNATLPTLTSTWIKTVKNKLD